MSLTHTASGARWDSVQAQREQFADKGLPGGAAALIPGGWHLKDQLLDALMYYTPPDVRDRVAREVPAAYNAYFARELLVVRSGGKFACGFCASEFNSIEELNDHYNSEHNRPEEDAPS